MKRSRQLLATGLVAVLLAIIVVPSGALAHERRTIGGGQFDAVVGWDVEPAYQGLKNAPSIRLSKAGTNPAEPVTGADKTLKIQVRQGATTREFPLRSVFGQPGYYVTDLIPTREGDYQFSFVGTIGDITINEKFDSADGKFDGIKPTSEMQFPVPQVDPAQVAVAAQAAQADAQSARTIGMIGIGVGVLGLVAGAAAWANSRRTAVAGTRTLIGRT
jgi:hypothetical protein